MKEFADALESYIIAEEGFFSKFLKKKPEYKDLRDPVMVDNKMRSIFEKIGFPVEKEIDFNDMSTIFEDSKNIELITSQDMKYLHSKIYSAKVAEDSFIKWDKTDEEMRAFVEKYEPLPIYHDGFGNYWVYLKTGKIDEFIHDSFPHFSNKEGVKYSSIEKAIIGYNKMMKEFAEA